MKASFAIANILEVQERPTVILVHAFKMEVPVKDHCQCWKMTSFTLKYWETRMYILLKQLSYV